jgi:histidinol phosphatase-like PHP family hydrolase
LGVQHPNFTYDGTGPEIVESLKREVTEAERLGFDSFRVMDHSHRTRNIGIVHEPMLDRFTSGPSMLANPTYFLTKNLGAVESVCA